MAYLKKGRYGSAQRGDGWVTPEYFGAKGDGATNDAAAINAALTAMNSQGGGTVLFGPRSYVINSTLTVWGNVCMQGIPRGTYIYLNHPSTTLMNFSTFGAAPYSAMTKVEGISFNAFTTNSGTMIANASGHDYVNALIENCELGTVNSGHTGRKVYEQGDSRFSIVDCEINHTGTVECIMNTGGGLRVQGGIIRCPSTYTASLVFSSGDFGCTVQDTTFDFNGHASGADPVAVSIDSAVGAPCNITGNIFKSTGAGPVKYALRAKSGSNTPTIKFDGNSFNSVERFKAIGGVLSRGTYLELLPFSAVNLSGSSYPFNDGIANQTVRFTGGSPPSLTLPTIYYPGQVFHFTVFNNSGNWPSGFGLLNYGYKAPIPALSNGQGASATFIAQDPLNSGTFQWNQIGGWAILT